MAQSTLYPTADTYISLAGGNQGTSIGMVAGQLVFESTAIPARILLRFDLSWFSVATISATEIDFVLSNAFFPDAPHDVYAHDLTTTAWVENEATYVKASNSLNWTTQGGDFNPTPASTVTVTNGDASLALTGLGTLAESKKGGDWNVLVKCPEGVGHNNHFFTAYTTDDATEANWPTASITWDYSSVDEQMTWVAIDDPLDFVSKTEPVDFVSIATPVEFFSKNEPIDFCSIDEPLDWVAAA